MNSTCVEEMYRDDLRLAERYMLFAALRQRRGPPARRRRFSALLWLFGLN